MLLFPIFEPNVIEVYNDFKVIEAEVTGYSSEVGQTDSTPYLTAAQTKVRDGVIANNCLPFGARVEIDGIIYVVEDRMNIRYNCFRFDIYKENKLDAIKWGIQKKLIKLYQPLEEELWLTRGGKNM